MTKYYYVIVICGNCKYKGVLQIKKGILVTETKCPDCECYTLVAKAAGC